MMTSINERAKDYASLLKKDETVLLYVENCEEPYKVQRSLLFGVSHWFEKALSDRFIEGQKLELRFPDTETETLELFLFWLFHGDLPHRTDNPASLSYDELQKQHQMYLSLGVFADKHLMPMLTNAVITCLYELTKPRAVFPTIETIRFAFENTAPESSLRAFLIDVVSAGLWHFVKHFVDDRTLHGYTIQQGGSLGDIPGYTEELTRRFVQSMWPSHAADNFIRELDEYLEDTGADGRGTA